MTEFIKSDQNSTATSTSTSTPTLPPTSTPTLTPTSTPLPAVLILGGCGFIGRNLVHYLVTQQLAIYIKIADKAMPEMSYFHDIFMESFQSPIVEYQQNDLTKPPHIDRAFTVPPELNRPHFDIVINLAAETRQSQPADLYDTRCTLLAKLCSQKAVDIGIPRFIQVSTAQVYQCSNSINPKSKPALEDSPLEPWTAEAKSTMQAENAVLGLSDRLEVVVLRLAFVYGEGDSQMIMTRAVCGAVYTELKEEMTLLWGGQMKINTVHVTDVCRAIVHSMDGDNIPRNSIFNVCDNNDTDQGKINVLLRAIFKIKTSFYGRIISNIASLRLADVVDTANEKHLKPWNDLCMRNNILNTPLTPYMSADWLDCHHLHVSGKALETTGFTYEHPELTEQLLRSSLRHAEECGIFPPSCCTI